MKPIQRSPQGEEKPSARRRLIRGMFSTAAVVPLASGAQVAASSAIRCFNNTPVNQGAIADNMYGVGVVSVVFNDASNVAQPAVLLVKRADVSSLGSAQGFSVSALTTGATSGWLNLNGTPYTVPSGWTFGSESSTSTRLPLRFVNMGSGSTVDMRAVGIGLAPTTAQNDRVLYASCWASFKP